MASEESEVLDGLSGFYKCSAPDTKKQGKRHRSSTQKLVRGTEKTKSGQETEISHNRHTRAQRRNPYIRSVWEKPRTFELIPGG